MNPKPDKLIPALYGGIVMALISSIPFLSIVNCLCCAGVLLGGFLAVFFYKNMFTPDTAPFTAGDCMAVGAIAGVIGAVVSTALSVVFLAMFGNIMGHWIYEILKNMDVNLPPEAWDKIDESLNSPLTIVSTIVNFFGSLMIDTLFGLLGGLIGYSVYKPKHVMPPAPMPPPSPSMPG